MRGAGTSSPSKGRPSTSRTCVQRRRRARRGGLVAPKGPINNPHMRAAAADRGRGGDLVARLVGHLDVEQQQVRQVGPRPQQVQRLHVQNIGPASTGSASALGDKRGSRRGRTLGIKSFPLQFIACEFRKQTRIYRRGRTGQDATLARPKEFKKRRQMTSNTAMTASRNGGLVSQRQALRRQALRSHGTRPRYAPRALRRQALVQHRRAGPASNCYGHV